MPCTSSAGFGGLKPCLSSWKSAQADLLEQPKGLSCAEQMASATLVHCNKIASRDERRHEYMVISHLPDVWAIYIAVQSAEVGTA
jgi:hypothetical protein